MLNGDPGGESVQVGILEAVVHIEHRREDQLHVWQIDTRSGLDERSRLGDGRGERTSFEDQVVEYVSGVVGPVQPYWLRAFILDAYQQVILQILSHAGQVGYHRNIEGVQI